MDNLSLVTISLLFKYVSVDISFTSFALGLVSGELLVSPLVHSLSWFSFPFVFSFPFLSLFLCVIIVVVVCS
jgi:hypothetical protein